MLPLSATTRGHTVTVVIPRFRVAPHIAGIIGGLTDWVDHVVVDDGSPYDLQQGLTEVRHPTSCTSSTRPTWD